MNGKVEELLAFCDQIISGSENDFLRLSTHSEGHSERVIETSWAVAFMSQFESASLLDVGFTMGSMDYLGALLSLEDAGHVKINAVDIVRPERVAGRYLPQWRDRILNVPVDICDIREYESDKQYDLISCISTIEHVGFDIATYDDPKSAFERCQSADEVSMLRAENTDCRVLDAFAKALKDGGYALISVPVGKGAPVLLQDSMGLYCAQWEYSSKSWKRLIQHPSFAVKEQRFFQLNTAGCWDECLKLEDITDKTGEMKSHAEACAVVVLQKRGG